MTTYEKVAAVVALGLAILGSLCILAGGTWWIGLTCATSGWWIWHQAELDADDAEDAEELDEE